MRSLYVKFVVMTTIIMLFSFLIGFFISNTYYQQSLKPANDEKNTDIAIEMAEFIENNPEVDIADYLNNVANIGYQLYLVDESHNDRYFGAEFRETALQDEVIEEVLNGDTYHGMVEFPRETFVTGFFANELENTIGVNVQYDGENYALFMRPDIKLLFDEMHLLFGLVFSLTIVLSIILVLVSAHFLIRPVSKLSRATKEVAQGNYEIDKLSTHRKDELGELSVSFVDMAGQIEENEKMRKDFISNISHDVQSPLSNIKGYTTLLYNDELSSDEKHDYLSIIESETNRLSAMTNQLLVLSSLDHESHVSRITECDVTAQITELLHSYEWKMADKGIMLSHTLRPLTVEADPSLLNMVWDNLISNAIKYNTESGSIDIEVKEQYNAGIITVGDTGVGIDNREIKNIFDRFYRVDNARSNHVSGTGLGLSIVQEVIHQHNGTIEVDSDEEGTTFIVRIPK